MHQSLNILKKYYITDSMQMVTRWIRQGKIRGERSENRRDGYSISHVDLFEFIEEERPGLSSIMAIYEEYQEKEVPKEITAKIYNRFDDCIDNNEESLQEKEEEIQKLNDALQEIQHKLMQLKEDYEFLTELYETLDEEYQLVKNDRKVTEVKENENKKNNENQEQPLTIEEVKKVLGEVISKMPVDANKIEQVNKEILNIYFDEDGKWKNGIYLGASNYYCPIKKKQYKYIRTMLRNVVKFVIDK